MRDINSERNALARGFSRSGHSIFARMCVLSHEKHFVLADVRGGWGGGGMLELVQNSHPVEIYIASHSSLTPPQGERVEVAFSASSISMRPSTDVETISSRGDH